MPLGPGVRFRVKHSGGKNIRLAFKGDKVVEAKDLGPTKKPKVRLRTPCK